MNYSNNINTSDSTITKYFLLTRKGLNGESSPIMYLDQINIGNVTNFGYKNYSFSTFNDFIEVLTLYINDLNTRLNNL